MQSISKDHIYSPLSMVYEYAPIGADLEKVAQLTLDYSFTYEYGTIVLSIRSLLMQ